LDPADPRVPDVDATGAGMDTALEAGAGAATMMGL